MRRKMVANRLRDAERVGMEGVQKPRNEDFVERAIAAGDFEKKIRLDGVDLDRSQTSCLTHVVQLRAKRTSGLTRPKGSGWLDKGVNHEKHDEDVQQRKIRILPESRSKTSAFESWTPLFSSAPPRDPNPRDFPPESDSPLSFLFCPLSRRSGTAALPKAVLPRVGKTRKPRGGRICQCLANSGRFCQTLAKGPRARLAAAGERNGVRDYEKQAVFGQTNPAILQILSKTLFSMPSRRGAFHGLQCPNLSRTCAGIFPADTRQTGSPRSLLRGAEAASPKSRPGTPGGKSNPKRNPGGFVIGKTF